jgi:hypothetical protein
LPEFVVIVRHFFDYLLRNAIQIIGEFIVSIEQVPFRIDFQKITEELKSSQCDLEIGFRYRVFYHDDESLDK